MLRKLQLTRSRQKAWREDRPKMEAIRRQATARAKAVKDEKDMALRRLIATWPAKMSPEELRTLAQENIEYGKKRYSSLTYRFTRKGMLRFGADGLWHNLCHLSLATSLPEDGRV